PTLMDVARECVGQQILRLRILPLFLSVGAHLTTDVPEQVNEVRAQFPQLEVEVLASVGEDPRLAHLIQQIVIERLNHGPTVNGAKRDTTEKKTGGDTRTHTGLRHWPAEGLWT
ncbi:MAG TPA: CbiX/SirB N-terminal domain-containing protein, partial [Candidatus Bathyarchaeia archaeon]|nr:CbiX/SirB N-terminal domain-containing protein [Candidatus Bathyarchaeia archaeon]